MEKSNGQGDRVLRGQPDLYLVVSTLPEGRKTVGGRWVYSIKEDSDGHDQYKARFVAKGYSQRAGIDYGETFSPTANLTSVRVVMHKGAQDNLILNQMDVKTAARAHRSRYLVHLWPETVGRNWNEKPHTCPIDDNFTQNPADYFVYTKESKQTGKVTVDHLGG